jgi:hypothetical protein
MGYSIATPLKSAKARDEMWAFMQEHHRPWHEVEPSEDELQPLESDPGYPMSMAMPQGPTNPDYDWTGYLCRDGDLHYDNGKHRIGFNYGAGFGPCGDYGWATLRWMALRAGRVRTFKKGYGIEMLVPYTVYDGYEAWPVLDRDHWEYTAPEKARWCRVDRHGCKPVRREWIPPGDLENVERKVTLHTFKSKDAILAMLRKQKLDEGWIAEAAVELDTLPTVFEGTEPTWVRRLFDELQKLGCKVTLEKGPFVLDGWRKATADAIDHAYVAREQAILTEMSRLTALWVQHRN